MFSCKLILKLPFLTFFTSHVNSPPISLKSLIPLIRDIPLNRLLALKLCIMKYDSAGVEMYLLSNTSKLLDAFSTEYKIDEYDFSNKKVIISYE